MDYKSLTKKTEELLNSEIKVLDTFESENIEDKNVYKGWVTAISIDLHDFKKLFQNQKQENITRIVKSFSNNIISIGKIFHKFIFSSINDDEIILVYKSPLNEDIYRVFNISICMKSYMDFVLCKKVWEEYGINLNYGIGIALGVDNIITKYGHNDSDEDSEYKIIGSAIKDASLLSDKNNINKIRCNRLFYTNLPTKYNSENQWQYDSNNQSQPYFSSTKNPDIFESNGWDIDFW